MKKILLIIVTIFNIANASWFSSDNIQEEPMLKSIEFSKIEQKIGKVPMMLEFGATSCHSCVVMGKLLYKIKQKYPNANIYFIDIYKDKKTAKRFTIRMIPTQKYLDKNGNIVETHMGILTQEELEKKLKILKII